MEISIKNIGETKLNKKFSDIIRTEKRKINWFLFPDTPSRGTEWGVQSAHAHPSADDPRSTGPLVLCWLPPSPENHVAKSVWHGPKGENIKNKKQKLYIATCIYKKDVCWKLKTEIHVFHTSIFECLVFMCL